MTRSRIQVLKATLVAVLTLVIILMVGRVAEHETPGATSILLDGSKYEIVTKEDSPVLVLRSKHAIEELLEAVNKKDEIGIREILYSDQTTHLFNGTKVLVLDSYQLGYIYKMRVLSGEHVGEIVYMNPGWSKFRAVGD